VEGAHPFIEFKTSGEKKDLTSSDSLKNFIEASPERKANLFRTFLGFVVCGIVLQLADRHGMIEDFLLRSLSSSLLYPIQMTTS
jgi:hypothetical protein